MFFFVFFMYPLGFLSRSSNSEAAQNTRLSSFPGKRFSSKFFWFLVFFVLIVYVRDERNARASSLYERNYFQRTRLSYTEQQKKKRLKK